MLSDFLNFMEINTENVRKVLQKRCDEANYVLRPWIIETSVSREVDENYCSCTQTADYDLQVEEIAMSIEKALTQAQKFRETLSQNLREGKKRNPKPTLQQIYAPKAKSQSKSEKAPKSSQENLKKADKLKPKNFIAANKQSVRVLSQKNSKSSTDLRRMGSQKSLKSTSRYPSVTELDNLIKKISLSDSPNSASSPSLDSARSNCPLHGENHEKFIIEKKRVTMDVVEALNQFGVFDELLRPLKIYNSYITKGIDGKRSGDAKNQFLEEFDLFNKSQLEDFEVNSRVLLFGFSDLYCNLHKNPLNTSELLQLKRQYIELDILSKNCGIKRYDTLRIRKSDVNSTNFGEVVAKGWSNNGIWNCFSINCLSMFTEPHALTIRYSTRNELLSLFSTIQRFQQTHYQKDLQDLIIRTVIPLMKTLDPASDVYLKLYKMIFAVAQILNPREPILVKMEQ